MKIVHDDHFDPEFRMDWTLSHMFAPAAKCMLERVIESDKKLKNDIEQLAKPPTHPK